MLKTETKNKAFSNYISLTGYKTLFVLNLLNEAPKSLREIQADFFNNSILKEEHISIDAIRYYINTLKDFGCIIEYSKHINKFILKKSPFDFDISLKQIKIFQKIFKDIKSRNAITDLENFESFIRKICHYIHNEETLKYLNKFLIISKLNPIIYNQIKEFCNNKTTAFIDYNSPSEKSHFIKIVCNKIFIKSEKIYVSGNNINHNEFSSLLISRIKSIQPTKDEIINPLNYKDSGVICEIYNKNYIPEENEEILKWERDKIILKLNGKDEFRTIQKILYLADECKILHPLNLRTKISNILKEMKNIYE